MSNYEFLLYNVRQGVATVCLNRPKVYNALNDVVTYELQDVFKAIARNDDVRVVVLTGSGKAFCSGQDLKEAVEPGKKSFRESLHKRYNPIIRAMRALPKPIICRLNGVAAGAGCSLALACDLIVAAESAILTQVFINIGLVPDSGSSWFLPRLTGRAQAFELCTMGSKVSAAQALTLGLVNRVVADQRLDEVVADYVEYYANAPTRAIGLIKKMLDKSANATLEEMLEYEAWCQEIAGATDDHREGVTAFVEKRKPRFLGK